MSCPPQSGGTDSRAPSTEKSPPLSWLRTSLMGSCYSETSEGWPLPCSKAEDPGFSSQTRQTGPGSGFRSCLTSLSLLFTEAWTAGPRPHKCSISPISSVACSEQFVMGVEPGQGGTSMVLVKTRKMSREMFSLPGRVFRNSGGDCRCSKGASSAWEVSGDRLPDLGA